MRYIALIIDDEYIDAETPTSMTDEEAILLDEMLHKKGILTERQEIAITEDSK